MMHFLSSLLLLFSFLAFCLCAEDYYKAGLIDAFAILRMTVQLLPSLDVKANVSLNRSSCAWIKVRLRGK